ncbi:vWA domain-containing protein [Parasediminibacterium sp. JCM 36343]|uniref:vWA domain-containing protein n=1 Tax=Parasediminibacterium sp. JCM 36343 TaxID=3374279 RepID=UPI00397A958D
MPASIRFIVNLPTMLYNWWQHNDFAYPWVLPLLSAIPYLIYFQLMTKGKQAGSFTVTTTHFFRPSLNWKLQLRHLPFVLRCMALVSLIVALARPQEKFTEQQTTGEGIDIILCFDISGSMTGQDFKPNRLEAAKAIATDFVQNRPGDRIGIVIFSSQSFTLCPITTDHQTVLSQINNIQNGYLTEDGTAIGSGLATSVDRLKDSKSATKIVVLLTDGVDFGGVIPPDIAEKLAKTYNIKVYCIGIGSNQDMGTQEKDASGNTIPSQKLSFNDNLLKTISRETGGQYFAATDQESLEKSYATISQLEKSKIETTTYNHYTESFLPFVLFGLCCIVLEFILRLSVFKNFP